jgi:hypothetical protein
MLVLPMSAVTMCVVHVNPIKQIRKNVCGFFILVLFRNKIKLRIYVHYINERTINAMFSIEEFQ